MMDVTQAAKRKTAEHDQQLRGTFLFHRERPRFDGLGRISAKKRLCPRTLPCLFLRRARTNAETGRPGAGKTGRRRA